MLKTGKSNRIPITSQPQRKWYDVILLEVGNRDAFALHEREIIFPGWTPPRV